MAWKILLLSTLSISLVGCRSGRSDLCRRESVPRSRLERTTGTMEIQFEASYERDGARVAIRGRI